MLTEYLRGENNEAALAALAMQEAFKLPRDDEAMEALYTTVDHDSLIKGLVFISSCIAVAVTKDETPHRFYSFFRAALNAGPPLETYEDDAITLMEASLEDDEAIFELVLCSVTSKVEVIAALCATNVHFVQNSPYGDFSQKVFDAIRSTLIQDYLKEDL